MLRTIHIQQLIKTKRVSSTCRFLCVSKKYTPVPLPGISIEQSQADYFALYNKSIENPKEFWREKANKYIDWIQPFTSAFEGEFSNATVSWFTDGKLNVCYNAIDRHVLLDGEKVAIRWEGDEPGNSKLITYREMQSEVSRIANVMKAQGVKKGDVVTIYMPMIPQLPMVMLACARIGAIHSVVFAGFSSGALKDRLTDCNSKWVFTADEGRRGGKSIRLKDAVDEAVKDCKGVNNVFVFKHTGGQVNIIEGKDLWMHELLPMVSDQCAIEQMDSDDPLFILYTSGSTGKPKGLVHATGGYSVYAAITAKNTFDLRKDDVFCCVADCGWITGHSYIVYGPLINGVTSVMFESVPTYPNPYRYWDVVQRVKATQFYTAPTAIRTLMRFPEGPIKEYDLSTLRVIGSVGEPINPEAWKWYYDFVGHEKCNVVDTYWQTETGGHIVTNLPGTTMMKPGSCAYPFYGVQLAVLDATSGTELSGNDVEGVLALKAPWPGMAKTIFGDHERFLSTYMKLYKGYYFTGDACKRDHDGAYWITGRVDDVINPSGHRIGTAELESVLDHADEVSETAVVGFPHEIKGEGIVCYVVLKEGVQPTDELTNALKSYVRTSIGSFGVPDYFIYSDLPKTRSGKIMRRILRKIAAGVKDKEELGDVSTLADSTVVDKLIEQFSEARAKANYKK